MFVNMRNRPAAMMTASQAAQALGVDARTVYRLIQSGSLPAINCSTGTAVPRWRIRAEDFRRFQTRRMSVAAQD